MQPSDRWRLASAEDKPLAARWTFDALKVDRSRVSTPQRGNMGLRNLRAGYTLRNQSPVCAIRISANSGIRIGSDCWVRYGSNIPGQNEGTNDDKGKDCIYLGSGDYS